MQEDEPIGGMMLDMIKSRVGDLNQFEISCTEIDSVETVVSEQISKFKDCNVFIAPMNTKLSTVGVAGAAFRHPNVQICYASATQYNIRGYSTPSDQVLVAKVDHDFWRETPVS